MTVAELIEQLIRFDPADVVCVDPNGFRRGVFPVDDDARAAAVSIKKADYACVVLSASRWP